MEDLNSSSTSQGATDDTNLSLSLDEIIKQRRNEQKQKQKRAPVKSKKGANKNKPTPTQKAVGQGKAKRNSKMAAKRGLGGGGSPSKAQVDKEVYRQQRKDNAGKKGKTTSQACKIYVGNLPWEATWQQLKDFIRDEVPSVKDQIVHAEIMTQNNTNRSKGYGIVEFSSPKAAQEACRALDETEFEGRTIYVREDRIAEKDTGAAASAAGPSNSCSVYVGNLSFKTSWQDLKDHMRQAGNVDNAKILSGPDGRSKGCGVVVYQHPKDAKKAISTLHDSMLDGREILVREDQKVGGQHQDDNNVPPHLSVFVGNLSYDTKWQSLKDHMRQAGNVDRATIISGPDGRSKGCGFVVYQHPKDVTRAIKTLHDSMLDGREIFVREYREN